MTLSQLTELLGWASIINIGYLMIATLCIMFMQDTLKSIHSKMLGVDEEILGEKYFHFLSSYKIIMLTLVVAPYLALKIMGF